MMNEEKKDKPKKICKWTFEDGTRCEKLGTMPKLTKTYCRAHHNEYHRTYKKNRRGLIREGRAENTHRRGRQPGLKGLQKKMEAMLVGQIAEITSKVPHKQAIDAPEHVRFVIDTTAMGFSARYIIKLMKDKYGETAEQILNVPQIMNIQRHYFDYIEARRRELRVDIPITNPVSRVQYLQEVIDKALGGVTKFSKDGKEYTDYELGTVIQAVKEMNAMQKILDDQKSVSEQELRVMREIEEQKQTIREYIAEQKKLYPNKSELELLREVTSTLAEDYEAVLQQMEEEMRTKYEN